MTAPATQRRGGKYEWVDNTLVCLECGEATPRRNRLNHKDGCSANVSVELLTPTEFEIASLITQGATSKDIANRLNISPKTVNHHRVRVHKKLGATNSADMTRRFIEWKLSKDLLHEKGESS